MAERYVPRQVANNVMRTLKDFQRATVNHVIKLYGQSFNRVLVADEVGLGKTVVARGVIARFAALREKENDDLVKVAYICSNQNIVRQNVRKLQISSHTDDSLDMSETRLSMQHLLIAEQEGDPNVLDDYVQIIPLTPGTSFQMTHGIGLRRERALIYVMLDILLKEMNSDVSREKLRNRLYAAQGNGREAGQDEEWRRLVDNFRRRVDAAKDTSRRGYPHSFLDRLKERGVEQIARDLANGPVQVRSNDPHIRRLRLIFAEESAAMLEPDLVIMDEFQRFRFLLNAGDESETGILVKRFLNPPVKARDQPRVLLLSATPYKLYSTAAEVAETGCDEAYQEFVELLDFIFKGREAQVKDVWSSYTRVLREQTVGTDAVVSCANRAADALSSGICRTERISVMEDGDYLESRGGVEIVAGDVASYVEFSKLLKLVGLDVHLPVDYVKSCPYLMSYLSGYQLKEKIERGFTPYKKKLVKKAGGRYLWLSKNDIELYRPLAKANARLEALKSEVFRGDAALYIWMPPILPYYPLAGVYKNAEGFSKILVFSSWEMVPRMIATLLSYEAERLAVSHLGRRYSQGHSERLRAKVGEEETAAYEALVAPVGLEWLVGLWDPIKTLNRHLGIVEIEREIYRKVRKERPFLDEDEISVVVDKAMGSPAVCIARRIGCGEGRIESVRALAKIFFDRFNSAVGTGIVDLACHRPKEAYWRNVLKYCKEGCFQAMFDEYYAVVRDELSFASDEDPTDAIVNRMEESLKLRDASYEVDTHQALRKRVETRSRKKDTKRFEISMRTHFAVGFAKGKSEETAGIERKDAVRRSFNSPLRPFVLASTSIGQEGLDFHPYCRKIFHWNLPSNPIDLEQREGRINRYKGLVVRENVARKYGMGKCDFKSDVWSEVYDAAEVGERTRGMPELIPFWCFGKNQEVKIDRIVPTYPCSRDEAAYDRLITILSVYRLSMGQPRQEELLEHVLEQCPEGRRKELKKLFLNLSPFMRKKNVQNKQIVDANNGEFAK